MHSPTNNPIKNENPNDDSLQSRLSDLSPAQKELLKKKLAQRKKGKLQAEARGENSSDPASDSTAIAIVGMGCRFPGAADLDAYWELIQNGRSAIDRVPEERWSSHQFFDPTGRSPGKMSVDRMGAVDGHDQFDPAFFGIAPREASRMDPQQRLLLEVAWETFENAGIPIDQAAGTKTGVFVGIGGTDYSKVPSQYPNYYETIDAHIGTGNALSIASARISYLFDFRGPSFIVDTACSSALVAIHQAIASLRSGESDAALAGGVNMILTPETTIAFSKARMLSPVGQCRPFDDDAAGYVRGEGCGLVLLKRLEDAKESNDEILGVIRGSAINQDGRTSGITAPNAQSQVRVIRSALSMAKLSIDDIDYIEAHGTGTPLGDPIELTALAEVFAKRSSEKSPIRIGSVKANIGHTETASGIAGLLKVLLMFRHRTIPAQTNFDKLNSNIQLPASALKIASQNQTLESVGEVVSAGVSSFGFGGTNAHLVVQSASPSPGKAVQEGTCPPQFVLTLSASDPAALTELASRYRNRVSGMTAADMDDLCFAAATRRAALPLRAAIVGEDADSIEQQLVGFKETFKTNPGKLITGRKPTGRRPRIAMIFTGQGSQYVEMGKRLYETLPLFRESIEACQMELSDHLPMPLRDVLNGKSNDSVDGLSIDDTQLTQPAICAIQCAIVDTLRACGIKPDVIAGHSIGEIAAFYACGGFTRSQALKLAAIRGKVMGELPSGGSMAAILTSEETVANWISEINSQAVIATINGPAAVVVAGTQPQVESLIQHAAANEVATRRLNVSHAFHSPLMRPAMESLRLELESFLSSVKLPVNVTFVSSVTGDTYDREIDIDYWVQHLIKPVRFFDVIKKLSDQKIDLAIEVGPAPHLSAMIGRASRANPDHVNYTVVSTLGPKSDDFTGFLNALASSWCIGAAVDWKTMADQFPRERQRIQLPNYPFQRSRYWLEPEAIGSRTVASAATQTSSDTRTHPLLGAKQTLADGSLLFTSTVRSSDPNYIADHVVGGSIIVPGAAWIETIGAAAKDRFPDGFVLSDLEIGRAVFLEEGQAVSIQCRVVGGLQLAKVEIAFQFPDADEASPWQVCATANVHAKPPEDIQSLEAPGSQANAGSRTSENGIDRPQDVRQVSSEELYEQLQQRDLQYGEFFRTVEDIVADDYAVSANLTLADLLHSDADQYILHPALLDGCFHLFAAVDPNESRTFLPVGVQKIQFADRQTLAQSLPDHAIVRRRKIEQIGDTFMADVQLFSADGHPIALLSGVKMQSLQRSQSERSIDPADWSYRLQWTAVTPTSPTDDKELESASWSIEPFVGDSDLAARTLQATASLMQFLQDAVKSESSIPHFILTQGGLYVSDDDCVDPISSAAIALARVAANEHPGLQIKIFDLPAGYFESEQDVASVLQLFHQLVGDETEMAMRHGVFFAGRMVASNTAIGRIDSELSLPTHGHYRIGLDGTDRIEGTLSERVLITRPKPDEVSLEIFAAGMNFSDVLKAMGLYPGLRSDEATPMGIEVCGQVTEVGSEVKNLNVGDRVMGVVPYGFATVDATKDHLLAKVPQHISDEEAASIPIVFLTAHHALLHIGRLCEGESILIHAGAGGVGLAAIQVAKSVGAEVFATAGNPTKRSLLCELGVPEANIFDSRDIASINAIRDRTGGRGVDVVLNSLPGDWIEASLGVLAAHGRFLEIGKTDIYQDRPLGLRPFQDNLSYSAIDLDRYLRERPAQVRKLFAEVVERFKDGMYQPTVIASFGLDQLPSAMRFMAARKNIGKIVVHPPELQADPAVSRKTHLITGGSGAIALGLAKRLVQRGATSIALVARRPVPETVEALQAWASAQGATVHYLQADCSDQASLSDAVDSLPEQYGQIGSVFHLAGVLDDGLIHEMTESSLEKVLQPKVQGAVVLAEVTADHPIDHFVMSGSVATVFGSPGQANYAAANGFLEGFAAKLRRVGRNACVVHFGPWAADKSAVDDESGPGLTSSGGMAEDAARSANLASRGLTALNFQVAVDQLIDAMTCRDSASPILVDADFGVMLSAVDADQVPSLLKGLKSSAKDFVSANTSARDEVFLSRISEQDPAGKIESLEGYFATQLGIILSLPAESLDPVEALAAFGLDSLMAIELKNSIEAKLDVTIPISKFINDPTLHSLAEAVANQLATEVEE